MADGNPIHISFIGDIMHIKFEEDIVVNKEIAIEMVHMRKKRALNNQTKLLAEYSRLKQASKEARDYMASEEASEGISACAIVSNSLMATAILNFYLLLSANNVKVPMRLFTNKENAIEWLRRME